VPLPEQRRRSSLVHELEVVGVGDVVPLQRERCDIGVKMRSLVVPSEEKRFVIEPERHAAGRNLNPLVRGYDAIDHRLIALRTTLLIEGKAMPHVEQRLLMHRLVLENGERGLRSVQQRITRTIEIATLERCVHAAIGFRGKLPHGGA
jgi:hypothetical protein